VTSKRFAFERTLSLPIVRGVMRRVLRTAGKYLRLPPQLEVDLNISVRPHYAYCVYHAAELARRLNLNSISVLEFGVAGGNGLLFLDQLARRVESALGVKIQLYGFDTGAGLPEITSAADLPYWFQPSQYKMDVGALLSTANSATLVLGNVRDTVSDFFAKYRPAPVGAILNDLDLYSSTSDSLKLFDHEATLSPESVLVF